MTDPVDLTWTRLEPVARDPEMIEGLRGTLGGPAWMLSRQWQLGEFQGEDAGTPVDVEVELAHDRLSAYQLHGGANPGIQPPSGAGSDSGDGSGDDSLPPEPVEYEGGPLEAIVEREKVVSGEDQPNARLSVQAGVQFLRLLERAHEAETGSARSFDPEDLPEKYLLGNLAEGDAPVDERGRKYAEFVAGGTADGHRIYRAVRAAVDADVWDGSSLRFPWSTDPDVDGPDRLPVPETSGGGSDYVDPTVGWFERAAREYHTWYRNLYDEPTDETGTAWDPERMEYRFRVATGGSGAGPDGRSTRSVLTATDYPGGSLGWYSFRPGDHREFLAGELNVDPGEIDPGSVATLDPETVEVLEGTGALGPSAGLPTDTGGAGGGSSNGGGGSGGDGGRSGDADTEVDPDGPTTVRREHLFPTGISFKGMPKRRYWAMEDGDVRLDEVAVDDATDQATVNFALVYGNDWYEVPMKVPLGSLTRVRELKVTDTFGETDRVPPVGMDVDGSGGLTDREGDDWSAFTVDRIAGSERGEPGLFLPPTFTDRVESDPVEEVALVRDEMANLAFAVETRAESPTGEPIDREEYGDATLVVESVSPAPDPADESVTFENPGDRPLDISGWAVSDGSATFVFPDDPEKATVPAGATVTLHTGTAPAGGGGGGGGGDSADDWGDRSSPTDYYWGRTSGPAWHGSDPSVLSVYDTDPGTVDDDLDHLRVRERIPGTESSGALPEASYRLATDLPDHWFPLRIAAREYAAETDLEDKRRDKKIGRRMQTRYRHYFELALALDADTIDVSDLAALPDPEGEVLTPYRDRGLAVYEEEITRAEKTVTRTYQQSTWVDGRTYLWSGRRARPGTDDVGSSTLRFDVVKNWGGDQE